MGRRILSPGSQEGQFHAWILVHMAQGTSTSLTSHFVQGLGCYGFLSIGHITDTNYSEEWVLLIEARR